MNELNPPETALDAMRDYFQANRRDFEALRAAGNAHDQRINELASDRKPMM